MNDREKYFKDVIENYKTMANDLAATRNSLSEEASKNLRLQCVNLTSLTPYMLWFCHF